MSDSLTFFLKNDISPDNWIQVRSAQNLYNYLAIPDIEGMIQDPFFKTEHKKFSGDFGSYLTSELINASSSVASRIALKVSCLNVIKSYF